MNEPLFDAWLRDALRRDPEPADDGFSCRVMAALPPQASRPSRRRAFSPAMRAAELAAVAVAAAVLAALPQLGLGGAELALGVASLLPLLMWWSLPQSKGSAWR